MPLETEVLKSKGKEPSGAIPGAKLQPGGHGALQATTERGVPNGTPGDPPGVGMPERPSQVGVPGKPPPPTVQQDQGRACVEDQQAPERERRVGGLQPVPRATIGKERPDTREPGPLGIAPQAGCEPSGAGRGVNRRGGKPPRPPAPKPKQAGGDGFEQGGGQQTGAALDKPSKRKASFVEGPNLEPGVTAKRPTPTPPAEKREDSALENSSGRGLRRNAKDQHSLVSHKPGCAGFKSGCNGCKLSGAMLEKASHVAEINIMGEDDSESDGGLDGDSDSGGPEEVKKSGGRSKPRGQAEDEERPRPISKELKTKYSVVCLQLLGAQTFSQVG